jgi:methane/ammonia monooxygenase subunit A
MTYTAICLWPLATLGRWVQWGNFVHYPMNFVWPTTMVPAGIFADWVLFKTKSFILTSVVGSAVFAFGWWVSNYMMIAPYLQPAQWMDRILTVADIQGISFIHSQTPEYLRIVEHGTLRSFLGETQYVALVFGATVTVAGYWIGQFIGRMLAIWPIGRFMKKW